MSVVAVAGGTGKLGRTIVEAIIEHGEHKVVVLARTADDTKAKELNVPILVIDYSNVNAIRGTLESNNIDTIIATLDASAGADPELALIKAADTSSTTKRYIPSSWGIRHTPEVAAIFSHSQAKIAILETLKASSLEYTTVINGFFADYFVTPKIMSHMGSFPIVLDIANNAAAIPGSGNVPVAFTHTTDVARFAAKLLSLKRWPTESYIVGEKLTWNEFLSLAEEAKGVKFDVTYDELEKLQKYEVTELPGQKDLYPFFPKPMLQGFVATFGMLFEKGFFNFDAGENVVQFKARGVRELVVEAGKTE